MFGFTWTNDRKEQTQEKRKEPTFVKQIANICHEVLPKNLIRNGEHNMCQDLLTHYERSITAVDGYARFDPKHLKPIVSFLVGKTNETHEQGESSSHILKHLEMIEKNVLNMTLQELSLKPSAYDENFFNHTRLMHMCIKALKHINRLIANKKLARSHDSSLHNLQYLDTLQLFLIGFKLDAIGNSLNNEPNIMTIITQYIGQLQSTPCIMGEEMEDIRFYVNESRGFHDLEQGSLNNNLKNVVIPHLKKLIKAEINNELFSEKISQTPQYHCLVLAKEYKGIAETTDSPQLVVDKESAEFQDLHKKIQSQSATEEEQEKFTQQIRTTNEIAVQRFFQCYNPKLNGTFHQSKHQKTLDKIIDHLHKHQGSRKQKQKYCCFAHKGTASWKALLEPLTAEIQTGVRDQTGDLDKNQIRKLFLK